MGPDVNPQGRVDQALVLRALCFEPFQHISINAHYNGTLPNTQTLHEEAIDLCRPRMFPDASFFRAVC
jgi:hypothetical protein